MDDNYISWQLLSAQIIIEIIEDIRITKDRYKKEALYRWFDTPYGNTICELAGMNAEYIKREVQYIENYKQANIRDDNKGIKETYKKISEKSKYKVKEYQQAQEGSISGCTTGDRLLEAFRYYKQAGKSCNWVPYSTKIRVTKES